MWVDLLLSPWIQRIKAEHGFPPGQRAAVIWDNVQFHVSDAVQAVFAEHNVVMAMLPKNCTSFLQPMDVTVNAPLKAAIRRMRCSALYTYMQDFQLRYRESLVTRAGTTGSTSQALPRFDPPKPTVKQAITTVIAACQSSLATDDFRKSLKRCFVSVGIAPYPDVSADRPVSERYRNFTGTEAWSRTLGSVPKSGTDEKFLAGDILTLENEMFLDDHPDEDEAESADDDDGDD